MTIRPAKDAGKPDPAAVRRKVRLSGKDSLASVAQRTFKDERVVPLLADLNPKAPQRGALPQGTVLVLPSRDEAQRFAARMGFQLGFDPAKGGSTKAKRNWKKMQHGARRSAPAASPEQLAGTLSAQGVPPAAAADRLAKLVDAGTLAAFANTRHDDPATAAIAGELQLLGARRDVRSALVALGDILAGTLRPRGRRALLDACAREPAIADETLAALLVVPPLREDLLAAAAPASALLADAAAIATLDEQQAEARLRDAGERRSPLAALADTLRAELPACADERLALLGVGPQLLALEKHLTQLVQVVGKVADTLERAPHDALTALLAGDAQAKLPKPWPLVVSLHAALGARVAALHAGRRAAGIGALMAVADDGAATPLLATPSLGPAEPDRPAAPSLSAAELAAAAAAAARHADAHDDVPERLTPTIIALFDALRPSAPDPSPEAQRKQRRKTRIEKVLLRPEVLPGDPDVIADLTDELLALARELDDGPLRRRAARVRPPVQEGAMQVARLATDPIPALLRGASDTARALVVAGLALDPEIGPTLAKPAGREAALALLGRHATRVVTLVSKAYADA